MTEMTALLAQITPEDVREILPEGLKTGVALWIRIGGPIGRDEFMNRMRERIQPNTRARSGWMCGVALLIAANARHTDRRNITEKMNGLLSLYNNCLKEFSACIHNSGPRIPLNVTKDPNDPYTVQVPTTLVTAELRGWITSQWPATEDGSVIPRGF